MEIYVEEDIDNITKNLESSSKTKDGIEINIPKFSFEYDLFNFTPFGFD